MVKGLLIFTWVLFHPVHVSLTSIDFDEGPRSFNVFVRMYLDDFILDSQMNGISTSNVDFHSGSAESKEIMAKYIGEKLIIRVNEKQLQGKIREMAVAENEISMNIEYSGGKKPETIYVKNLIMTNLYPDQSNMVIVKVDEFEEGVKLTPELTERTFKVK